MQLIWKMIAIKVSGSIVADRKSMWSLGNGFSYGM